MEKIKIANTLKQIILLLCKDSIAELIQKDKQKKITESEMRIALKKYSGNLSYPSDEAFNNFHVYTNDLDSDLLVEFNLWYDNKESDLTIIITIHNLEEFSIEDIRVL